MEYPKTENLYARDPETHKAGPEHGFRQPEVGLISKWLVTEKVDGMNMRVIFQPFGQNDSVEDPVVPIHGRSNNAQIPGDLLNHMQERFTAEALSAAFDLPHEEAEREDKLFSSTPDGYAWQYSIVLFGEGFGPGIQGAAGQAYGGEKRFILFDVVVNGTWLKWADVEDVARKLGVPTVPVLCQACDLEAAKRHVYSSQLLLQQGSEPLPVEGIVARTDPNLFDRFGRPLRFKYKVRDL